MGSSLWELPSCFFTRNLELEEAFSIPFTHVVNGPCIGEPCDDVGRCDHTHSLRTEISYSIRYPEFKPRTEDYHEHWVIRQTAIYHCFNVDTRQNAFVLFSPTPDSKGHRMAEEYLKGLLYEPAKSPYDLHQILIAAYVPSWRQYISTQEQEGLPTVSSISLLAQIWVVLILGKVQYYLRNVHR